MKRYLHVAKIAFFILAVAAITSFTWSSRHTILSVLSHAELYLLLQSVTIWILLHLLAPLFTSIVFSGLSEKICYTQAFHIHANRLPAKYLPGGIWHSVARVQGYRSSGISRRNIAIYLMIENLLSAGITLSLGGAIVYYYNHGDNISSNTILLLVIVSTCTLIATPLVLNSRLVDRGQSTLAIPNYLSGLVVAALFWIGASLAFLTFIRAMPDSDIITTGLEVMGIYLLSWGIGFITIFSPQGVGVAEYVSSQLLQHGIEAGAMIVLLVGFRVVVLSADLSVWLITVIFASPTVERTEVPPETINKGAIKP